MVRLKEIVMIVDGDQSKCRKPCSSVQQPESEQWCPFTCTALWSLPAGPRFLLPVALCMCQLEFIHAQGTLRCQSLPAQDIQLILCTFKCCICLFPDRPPSIPQASCLELCQSWMNCSHPAYCQSISKHLSAMPPALVPLPAHLQECAFCFTDFCIYFLQLTIG